MTTTVVDNVGLLVTNDVALYERCVAAQLSAAADSGAVLRYGERVLSLQASASGVTHLLFWRR